MWATVFTFSIWAFYGGRERPGTWTGTSLYTFSICAFHGSKEWHVFLRYVSLSCPVKSVRFCSFSDDGYFCVYVCIFVAFLPFSVCQSLWVSISECYSLFYTILSIFIFCRLPVLLLSSLLVLLGTSCVAVPLLFCVSTYVYHYLCVLFIPYRILGRCLLHILRYSRPHF